MKKYIPILLATSLLLSACSVGGSTGKKDTASQKSLFEQKQECEKYSDEANDYYKNNDGGISIFYSKKLDTCVVNFIGFPESISNSKDAVNPSTKKYIFNYLTKDLILQTENGIEWSNKIKELKGE